MALLDDLRGIVRTIYSEEGLKDSFLDFSDVKDLINDYYLSNFRDFNEYDDNKNGAAGYGGSDNATEQDRRKYWTGKKGNNSFGEQIGQILAVEPGLFRNTDAWLSLPEVATATPKIFHQYLYEKTTESSTFKEFLNFMNIIMSNKNSLEVGKINTIETRKLSEGFYSFVPLIKLNEVFEDYLSTFRTTELATSRKGMFRGIDYTSPSKHEKNHTTILERWYEDLPEEDEGPAYYDYIYSRLQKLFEDDSYFRYPFIGEDSKSKLREYFTDDIIGQLATALAKEYIKDSDDEVVWIFEQFLENLGFSKPDIRKLLTAFIFPELDFSACVVGIEVEEESDTTEQCIVTNYEPIPPDWTTMDLNKIYYDEKECSYAISIKTTYQSPSGDLIPKTEEYSQPATREILDLLSRAYTEDELNELSKKIVYSSYYINPKPLLKMRFLYKLSKLEVDPLDEDESDVLVEASVGYSIDKFLENIEFLAKKLNSYQRQYVADIYKKTGMKYNNLDFLLESDTLYSFKKSLNILIQNNTDNLQIYNTLILGFDMSENNIIFATLEGPGLKDKKLTNGFKSFSMEGSQKRKETLEFIRNLDTIINAFQISQDLKYDMFINDFMKPQPRKEQQSSLNMISRANNSGAGICEDLRQTQKQWASTKVIGERSVEFLKDEILKGFATTACLTKEQKEKLEKQEASDQEEKLSFSQNYKIPIKDPFFQKLPDIFEKISQKQGKDALNSLGTEFLDRLGVCGLGELVSLIANSILSFLNPDEYLDEITKCALKNMKMGPMSLLYAQIVATTNATGILDRYRDAVGDTILPWDFNVDTSENRFRLGGDAALLTEKETGANLDVRLAAIGDSIALTVDATTLLQTLRFMPDNEWMGFFLGVTDSILKQCKIPTRADVITGGNVCKGKKITMPELAAIDFSGGRNPFDFVVKNMKNLIINLTVKIITVTIKELLKNVAAGFAADVDYFKQGEYIPDFFQGKEYFHHAMRNASQKSYLSTARINQAFVETLTSMYAQSGVSTENISTDQMNNFVENASMVVGEKEKINLLKGQSSEITKNEILEISEDTVVGGLFSRDPTKIDEFFSQIGSMLDTDELESDLAETVENASNNPVFCFLDEGGSYEDALATNKDATPTEIQEQQNLKKDLQKEKLCNLTNKMAHPDGPIFGNLFKLFASKDGPIYGVAHQQTFEIFKSSLGRIYDILTTTYLTDFMQPGTGFLDLVLHDEAGNTKSRGDFLATFSSIQPGEALNSIATKLGSSTSFKCNFNISDFSPSTYKFHYTGAYPDLYYRQNSNNEVIVKIGSKEVVNFDDDTLKTGNGYNNSANNMYELLMKSLGFMDTELRDTAVNDILINGDNFPNFVAEQSYEKIKFSIRDGGILSAFNYSDWLEIYNSINQDTLKDLLNVDGTIDGTSNFYKKLDDDGRLNVDPKEIYQLPFGKIYSKPEAIQTYIFSEIMVKIYVIEFIYKSLCTFATFSSDFFERKDIISKYIIRQMLEDLAEFDKEFPGFLLSFKEQIVQLYTKKNELGIQDYNNSETQGAVDIINTKLGAYVENKDENRKSFLQSADLQESIEDIVSDFAENVIQDVLEDFFIYYGSRYQKLEQFALGSLLVDGEPVDVLADPQRAYSWAPQLITVPISDTNPKLRPTIHLEKYIFIEDKGGSSLNTSGANWEGTEKYLSRDTSTESEGGAVPASVSSRDSDLFGVVELSKWKDYLDSYNFAGRKISDVWKSWKFGIRVSYVIPELVTGLGDIDETVILDNKAYAITVAGDVAPSFSLLPIVISELPIEDQEIDSSIVDQYDKACLIFELIENPDFTKFFRGALDTETFISLLTIYNVENFTDLLKDSADFKDIALWAESGGKMFENIKKTLIETFER